MNLTPACRVTPDVVEQIYQIDDHAYRNRWIVYAYHDISLQLREILGANANFATFATWSSRIIGEMIRVDARPSRLQRWRDKRSTRRWNWIYNWPSTVALDVQQKWRGRTEGSVGQVMGYGNRMIFREIAGELSRFACQYGSAGNQPPWDAYQEGITATGATRLFPAAELQRFRDGMHAYYLALGERDATKQAELVLRGTLLISSYEQRRVDVVLKAAMSLFSRRLLRVSDGSLLGLVGDHQLADVELRRREQPWILRHRSPWRRWLANRYARRLTRLIMNIEIPMVMDLDIAPVIGQRGVPREDLFEELRLGSPLNRLPDKPLYLAPLDDLRDSTTRETFELFDRSTEKVTAGPAHDWSDYDDRMSYIANYFRARQGQPELFATLPYEYRIVAAMDVSDERLDLLRLEGDRRADEFVANAARASGESGRSLLSTLVRRGRGREEMGKDLASDAARTWWDEAVKLPRWADDARMRKGQEFFQRFKIEIASALFGAALPKSYTAIKGAKVLTETADRIAGDKSAPVDGANLVSDVGRRIAETGQMLLDVMGSDGGSAKPFRPSTRAYEAAHGVRFFHAAVRDQLLRGGEPWDVDRLGKPINQEDLLGTLTTFTVVVIEALHRMGAQITQDGCDAYVHLWLVVGHFLGIDYELLFPAGGSGAREGVPPLDYEELRVLMYRVFRRNSGASVEGCRLERALLDMQRSTMRVPGCKALPEASVRAFLGNEIADDLGVPHTRAMRPLIKLMFGFNVVRTYAYHFDWIAPLVRRRTHRMYAKFIREGEHGERPPWRMDSMKFSPLRRARTLTRARR